VSPNGTADKSVAVWRSWKHFSSVLLLTLAWLTAFILRSHGQVWWWQLSFNNVGDVICHHIPAMMREIKQHHSERLHCVLARHPLNSAKRQCVVCVVLVGADTTASTALSDRVYLTYGFLCSDTTPPINNYGKFIGIYWCLLFSLQILLLILKIPN
jgi:hypothetical protein